MCEANRKHETRREAGVKLWDVTAGASLSKRCLEVPPADLSEATQGNPWAFQWSSSMDTLERMMLCWTVFTFSLYS